MMREVTCIQEWSFKMSQIYSMLCKRKISAESRWLYNVFDDEKKCFLFIYKFGLLHVRWIQKVYHSSSSTNQAMSDEQYNREWKEEVHNGHIQHSRAIQ